MEDHPGNDSLLDIYIYENSQLIEQLEQTILACEHSNRYTPDAVDEIFRIMHTIKGSSAMMSFSNITSLSHALEELFDFIRRQQPQLNDYTMLSELVLQGGDFIKLELYKLRNGEAADGDEALLTSHILSYLEELRREVEHEFEQRLEYDETPKHASHPDELSDRDASAPNWRIAAHLFFEEDGMENVRAFQVIHTLKEYTDELTYDPQNLFESNESAAVVRQSGFRIFFPNDVSSEAVRDWLSRISGMKRLEIEERKEEQAVSLENPSSQSISMAAELSLPDTNSAPNHSHQTSFISVNVAKLDELMDLVGELVIAESMVTQNPDLMELQIESFQKASRQLRKITDEIQSRVMSIRMVPLSGTFQKMHRVVRDMCKKQQKSVHLELIGEDTEVDKNIIEHISDPLMHLVRNAIDHGMETTEERETKGKPVAGILVLEAKNVGNEVVITVRDDGRGLNKEKILRKAESNGLLSRSALEMTDREIYQLIFFPGFSTTDTVSEYSGRGVGMDVVNRNIESVGGYVSVDSTAGKGTTVTIRIPLTLAIIDGMNVKVGEARYTIPTTAIKQSFKAQPDSLVIDPDGNEMIMVRGQCYSIVRLYERFDTKTSIHNIEDGILIMAEQEGRPVCIFADELLGQQQVVVKNLPAYIKKLKNIQGLAGCTVLGDGSISLILDVGGLSKTI